MCTKYGVMRLCGYEVTTGYVRSHCALFNKTVLPVQSSNSGASRKVPCLSLQPFLDELFHHKARSIIINGVHIINPIATGTGTVQESPNKSSFVSFSGLALKPLCIVGPGCCASKPRFRCLPLSPSSSLPRTLADDEDATSGVLGGFFFAFSSFGPVLLALIADVLVLPASFFDFMGVPPLPSCLFAASSSSESISGSCLYLALGPPALRAPGLLRPPVFVRRLSRMAKSSSSESMSCVSMCGRDGTKVPIEMPPVWIGILPAFTAASS